MPKVYIAAAFRKFSQRSESGHAYGEIVDPDYVRGLEQIEDVFLDFDFHTCLPHRDEGMWGKVYYDPGAISALCLRHVRTSNVVFAIAEAGRGVHIELGYAAALGGKRLILAHQADEEPSTLIYGFGEDSAAWTGIPKGLCQTTIITYKDQCDLISQLRTLLKREYGSTNSSPSRKRSTVAMIDIGSHTVKLRVVSHRQGGHSRALHNTKASLGIMGDVLKTGQLAPSSLEAVLNLLSKWKNDCASLNCDRFVVTGTAALRKAVNASELCSCIKATFGWDLQIITPQQELDAVYAGVKVAFRPCLNLAVLNLGGGSTQIGVGSETAPSHRYLLDFGTRQLCDKWPWNGPLSADVYGVLLDDVRRRVRDVIRERPENVPSHLVHTGGELDFMLRCRLPLVSSELSPHHVSEISLDHFTRFGAEFASLAPDVVCRDFGLDPAWASGAVASNVIAQSVAEAIGVTAIVPSNCNVSDGLLQTAVQ